MSLTASIISAIVSSIIDNIVDAPPAPPAVVEPIPVARNIPPEARRGFWTPPIQHGVLIDGQIVPAAPGLQIRGPNNLIVLPMYLQDSNALPVRYQLDSLGNVWRLWILSAAEQAAYDSQK